jgi:hypothetical protein
MTTKSWSFRMGDRGFSGDIPERTIHAPTKNGARIWAPFRTSRT